MPRLVDWYFVEWWWTPVETKEIQKWRTMSCVWLCRKEKHFKLKPIKTDYGEADHIRFCIPIPPREMLQSVEDVEDEKKPRAVFIVKKTPATHIYTHSLQLSHQHCSKKYVLGGYEFRSDQGDIVVLAKYVTVGDYILTGSKFKRVIEIASSDSDYIWFVFKNEKYNMYCKRNYIIPCL